MSIQIKSIWLNKKIKIKINTYYKIIIYIYINKRCFSIYVISSISGIDVVV